MHNLEISIFLIYIPFTSWKSKLKDENYKISFHFDHTDKDIYNADVVIIQSRYFEKGWQNTTRRTRENEEELIKFLVDLKNKVGKVVWFDEGDSTGCADFPIIGYVDVLCKKQILKDRSCYTTTDEKNDLRIWLNPLQGEDSRTLFTPCPTDQIHKLKKGWCLAFNDYRFYRPKTRILSNYLGYALYSPKYSPSSLNRPLDLTFRGSTSYDKGNLIAFQRLKTVEYLKTTNLNIAFGGRVDKRTYLRELHSSKVSISPFGFGEICYRDFETFLSGALLIKPSMEHLDTNPEVFIANETYIPLNWDMSDLKEKVEEIISNYNQYLEIAKHGQEVYRKSINDPSIFIKAVKGVIE